LQARYWRVPHFVVEMCRNLASASSKELIVSSTDCRTRVSKWSDTYFSSIFIAPGIDFSFFCAAFSSGLFPFFVDYLVVIIINHRNRLFSSLVFQNVRNFSDVILKGCVQLLGCTSELSLIKKLSF
jgi:hypothetical protein